MANYTENYNLKKPAITENYSVEDANSNNDIIDKTLAGKQDKMPNKGLSTNDFTNEYKKKLDGLSNYDDTNIKNDISDIKAKDEEQDSQISELEADNKTNKTDISNLQEQQTTHDTLIQDLQAENALLKSQIPTGKIGPAEYISIKDSANMPFEEINISGNDYQNISQILPGGYTQLDYIEATGTQYIDTGYLPKDTAKYELLGTVPENPTKTMYIFGENDEGYDTPEDQWGYSCYARVTTKGAMSFLFGHDSDWNGIQTKAISGYVGNKHKFVVDKEGLYVDNILAQAYDETTIPFSKQKSLYLFALHYTDEDYNDVPQMGGGRIQVNNFKIYEDNVLIHDFIPCKRNSDSALGMYDYITKEFKTNAGTDTFVAGPVSVLPNKDYPIPSIYYPSEVRACGDNIQLFDKDNANILNASYNSTTRAITSNASARVLYIECEPNETYTISRIAGQRFVVGTTTNKPASGVVANNVKIDYTAKSITIETGENDNYIWAYYYLSTADTLTPEEILNSIKICKGTTTGGYSEYGQGSITVKKSNKNLFDGELEKGIINTTSGINEHNDWSAVRSKNYINVNGLTEITLSLINNSNTVVFFDKYKNVLSYNSTTNSNKRTVTLPENCAYIRYYEWVVDYTSARQIEEGTTATEVVPHEEKEHIVPTQQPLLEGDYLDLYNEEQVHTWDKIVLDGTETMRFNSTKENTQVFTITVENSTENPSLSNYFKANVPGDAEKVVAGNGMIHIAINKTVASTIEEFRVWLSEQFNSGTPVYVWYKTATETRVPFTEEQKAVLKQIKEDANYKNVTIITSEDEVKPIVSGVYYKDLETMFNNINNAIISLGGV